ncbi:hypothetical protein RHS04_08818 [Rhizoctonia solani]|uniref:Jacalin-type lectin domain-containing protein n=1 Tax=Rhizoctonia solani TaxID=456999 RepID=A0A8H7H3A4_9AGAM|nr:hypothetical protein RHS04_08818 [Rhizoctonia solani]
MPSLQKIDSHPIRVLRTVFQKYGSKRHCTFSEHAPANPIATDVRITISYASRPVSQVGTFELGYFDTLSGRQAIHAVGLKEASRVASHDESIKSKSYSLIEEVEEEPIIADQYSPNRLGAHYSHMGWLPPDSLPERPWSTQNIILQPLDVGRWVTRRILAGMWSVELQVSEIAPEDALVKDVESALAHPNSSSRIRALRNVFDSWGELIPVAIIVGAAISATGILETKITLEPASLHRHQPHVPNSGDFNSFIETQLQLRGKVEKISYHLTGSRPDLLFREGLDVWLKNIRTTRQWEIIKVTKAIPITEIFDSRIQERIKALFANLSCVFYSPLVGVPQTAAFKSIGSEPNSIRRIEIGFSDARIQSLSLHYTNGLIAGPYGCLEGSARTDRIDLAQGETITEIFVWPTDYSIGSLQLVKNTGYISPIYGAVQGVTRSPHLLSGDGNSLLGLSGSYSAIGITELQAIWRNNYEVINYKYTTTFAGGQGGNLWNDLGLIGDRRTARISEIKTWSPYIGFLSGFQTTYTFIAGGHQVEQRSAIHGTEEGKVTKWVLEEGEYITGVCGRCDGISICELRFITNRPSRTSQFTTILQL